MNRSSRNRLDWASQKAYITDLYVTQNKSRDEVLAALNEQGFPAQSRPLKYWIETKWRLRKSNQYFDMLNAVQLALDCQLNGSAAWKEDQTLFRVGSRTFNFGAVRRYCKRKGFDNPFEWYKSLPTGRHRSTPEVQIIPSADQMPTPQLSTDGAESETQASPDMAVQTSPTPEEPSMTRAISPPTQLALNEKLIWCAGEYCARFINSASAISLREPPVHMHTAHGKFGATVQDAIFQACQEKMESLPEAFKTFSVAQGMLRDLFVHITPMAFAQVFAVLCELIVASRRPYEGSTVTFLECIRDSFLRCLLDWPIDAFDASNPLRQYFETLKRSDNILGSLVESMHRMVDIFLQHEVAWTGLYLLERYCDCLYHAGYRGECQTRRAKLLTLQESHYGRARGNVLWTLTNVADDHIENRQFQKAEKAFHEAASRADWGLGGYAKVKIRFAAFEGLSRVAMAKIQTQSTQSISPTFTQRMEGLTEALNNSVLAEEEALKRADFSSRRLARVRLFQDGIRKEIQAIQTYRRSNMGTLF